MSISHLLSKSLVKTVLLSTSLGAILLSSGCATSELLNDRSYEDSRSPTSQTTKQILIEDQLVAFGRPAQALANMPSSSVVIVGEKNSYVLTEGGIQMVNILTVLDPRNIQVDSDMSFYSPNNDGRFQGQMQMSYAKLKDEFVRSDYQFFLQNRGTDCTKSSDTRMSAQRFCFNVPIKGVVYPQVSNISLIQSQYKALSRPYPVSIYTNSSSPGSQQYAGNAVEKLVLLPFAIAFDVLTFPIQLAEAIIE